MSAGLLLLATTLLGCGTDKNSAAPFDSMPIKVGFKGYRPGMSDLPRNSPFTGFEPHVALKVLQEALGRDYTSVTVTTADWQDALGDGRINHNKVDLVIADISEQDGLKGKYDLAGPYLQTPLGVMLKTTDKTVITKAEDLRPLSVCVQEKTTAYATMQLNGGTPPLTEPDLDTCKDRLNDGTVQAIVADYVVLQGIAVNSGTGTQHDYQVPRNVHIGKSQQLMMVLPKGHQKACEMLRKAISDYLQDIDWAASLKQYLHLDEFTDKEIIDIFRPVTTSVGDRCSA
ncbi:substrate-binding periplasmic protein [Kitasatospora sp. NPDC059795]|uniref:substrate-binding periplasmic protein n=1 Tax=Kitasatospora sp. NPDC059795 TaxID=3346949 RepID=UPI003664A266